ncbi:MAG: H+/Na+-translocating ferredoxin:NAD+ oxidoreductase subunit [Desulfomicrobiaceae bacterium]|nr:H+/Na+-translocating ferredoxin:NAD+ oxidoreductase subunit [Desulfomicrobiaceae bacterium]
MKKLSTATPLSDSIRSIPAPQRVRIALGRGHTPAVKRKQVVGKGQVLAETTSSGPFGVGFVHATIDGIVEDILPEAIIIGPIPSPGEGKEAPVPERPGRAEHKNLADEALVRWLREMGIDTSRFHPSRTVVVNGLNPEPGAFLSEQLLRDERATLDAGINLLERAVRPGNVHLVVARGSGYGLHGAHVVEADPQYPSTLDALVAVTATGSENPEATDVISVADLYRVGRVATTGLPLTEAVLTVEGHAVRVPTGTPIVEVLDALGVQVPAGATVALGGPMTGEAISSLDIGVPENCTAITIVPPGRYPQVGSNPCINCGECVLVCPARIQPGMLSRYAEFALFEETRPRHIAACVECGLCTYVCPANRPVLQYIRLAKHKLEEQDAFVATCRLQDE